MLEKHRIDIVCLAGFMRLLTPEFVAHWPGRMLNIHPALLPAFKGLDTHKRALASGREGPRRHGAFRGGGTGFRTDHRARRCCSARGDTEATLAARVLKVEHQIYPLALKLLAEGRIQVENGRCLIDGVAVPDTATLVPTE